MFFCLFKESLFIFCPFSSIFYSFVYYRSISTLLLSGESASVQTVMFLKTLLEI